MAIDLSRVRQGDRIAIKMEVTMVLSDHMEFPCFVVAIPGGGGFTLRPDASGEPIAAHYPMDGGTYIRSEKPEYSLIADLPGLDISKINVGDEVAVRAAVVEIDRAGDAQTRFVRLAGGNWVLGSEIIGHKPKPQKFKPGDPVTVGGREYEFIARYGDRAFIGARKGARDETAVAVMYSDLRPAENQ